ncbi:carbohydrate-binding protein [Streptomyces sp. NRRL S-813]|uniref:carbohydrate-binding protein n=1 Tax=Streptomyces sp. NRRL S-813 TaxID=1463919 RepID=UPI00131E5F7A|nr:carbohydrate-binding protein [Streptomyces sp. NRRL S-813]
MIAVTTALAVLAATWYMGAARPDTANAASPSEDTKSLAQWWAPVHFQDVDRTGSTSAGGKADYITSYDYDGDLDGRNNWENVKNYPLKAYVYYSVVETKDYAYLLYTYFHPRSWSQDAGSEQENDTDGVLLVVQKPSASAEHGTLKAAITVAGNVFYPYTPQGSDWKQANREVGTLSMDARTDHPRPFTAADARSHGVRNENKQLFEGDGIVYYPNAENAADEPPDPDKLIVGKPAEVKYALVDVFAPGGMWEKRDSGLFVKSEDQYYFAGDDDVQTDDYCGSGGSECHTDMAAAPWSFDDNRDGPGKGYIATTPGYLVWYYFNWPGKPAKPEDNDEYTWNPYQGNTPADPGTSPPPADPTSPPPADPTSPPPAPTSTDSPSEVAREREMTLIPQASGAPGQNPDSGGSPWTPGVTYKAGDTVTYEGITYRCIQGHTTQTGWEPPIVPALWERLAP